MSKHVLLDNVSHRNLRVRAGYAPGGAFDVNVARAFPVEFAQLQREYPLFFVRNPASGHFETIALLGFEDGENLYLGEQGWDASYVPLSIRRQPFLIGFQEQAENGAAVNVPVVHVDLEHPNVSWDEGTPVFLPQGGESPYLERVNSMLKAIHEGHAQSEALSRLLVGLDLVESATVSVEFRDGSTADLAGLYTVNENRLHALDGGTLQRMNAAGQLGGLYLVLASLESLPALVDRKNRRLGA